MTLWTLTGLLVVWHRHFVKLTRVCRHTLLHLRIRRCDLLRPRRGNCVDLGELLLWLALVAQGSSLAFPLCVIVAAQVKLAPIRMTLRRTKQ
jgi:hypothetical protein